ncbi:MAG: 50S ribosomal protein L19e [Candidatus Bathyarchaeota archaeon]|jgi:large subunit ribosomal protein L19e
MTDLKSQRRLAAEILKIGENRVWMDPDKIFDIEIAITRDEIRKLIHEGAIVKRPDSGVSQGRSRIIHEKKKRGRRRGPGTRTSAKRARISKKQAWMSKIRAIRKRISELKNNRTITEATYRMIYNKANSGRFESIADMERYLKSNGLWRKR